MGRGVVQQWALGGLIGALWGYQPHIIAPESGGRSVHGLLGGVGLEECTFCKQSGWL